MRELLLSNISHDENEQTPRSKPVRIALTDPFVKALPAKIAQAHQAGAGKFTVSAGKGNTLELDVPTDRYNSLVVVDTIVPQLQLRITANGTISYFCRYRFAGQQHRKFLGRYDRGVTLSRAREKAGEIVQALDKGLDPERLAQPIEIRDRSVKEVVGLYVEKVLKPKGLVSAGQWERMLDRTLVEPMGNRSIASITEPDIVEVIEATRDRGRAKARARVLKIAAIEECEGAKRESREPDIAKAQAAVAKEADKEAAKAGGASNRERDEIRKFFKWAVRQKYLLQNPAADIEKPVKERARERVLSDAELAAVWHNAPKVSPIYGAVVRMLILSACRLREMCKAARPEYNGATGDLTLAEDREGNRKSRRVFIVPLPETAQTILKEQVQVGTCQYFFTATGRTAISGWSDWKRKLDALFRAERAKLNPTERASFFAQPWQLRDLRRSVDTGMNALEVPPHIVGACLNHAIRGVEGRYNRHSYYREKKAALERWAAHVARITAPPADKVVSLHRQAAE